MIAGSTKSERSEQDSQAVLGVGATNTVLRLAASIGELQCVTPAFVAAIDIPFGGVLLALPALLSCGFLQEITPFFRLPKGGSKTVVCPLFSVARTTDVTPGWFGGSQAAVIARLPVTISPMRRWGRFPLQVDTA